MPPASRPTVPPSAPTPPQMPRALLRSAPSGNMFVTIDSAAGSTSAAPSPWTPRITMRKVSEVARPPAERGGGEDHQAGHQHAAAAEQVGGAAAEEHEAGEGQPVGGHHPLQVGLGEAELAADGGQGDVDDREVHDRDEVGHHQQRERLPALTGPLTEARGRELAAGSALDVQPTVARFRA